MHSRRFQLGIFALLMAGAIVRIIVSLNDLWLDEIWSLEMVRSVSKLSDLFFSVRSDNNHLLNSIYLFTVGPTHPAFVYRLLSLLASIISLYALYLVAYQKQGLEGYLIGLSYSFSAVFVLYDSEARGYAVSTACMIISWIVTQRVHEQKIRCAPIILTITAAIGTLGHLSFIPFYAALTAWSLIAPLKKRNSRRVLRNALAHAIPLALIVSTYFVYARILPSGSGPLAGYADVILATLSVPFGGPHLSAVGIEQGVLAILVAFAVTVGLLVEIVHSARDGDEEWILYLLVIFLMPALILTFGEPRVVFVRYFLPSIFFSYVVLAKLISRISSRSRDGRILAYCAVMCFILGNGFYLSDLLRFGRGQYSAALRFIDTQTQAPVVHLASDHDFRNGMVINYFSKRLSLEHPIVYHDQGSEDVREVEWYLIHEQDRSISPKEEITGPDGTPFRLEASMPYSLLSGWSWFVYRRVNAPEEKGSEGKS